MARIPIGLPSRTFATALLLLSMGSPAHGAVAPVTRVVPIVLSLDGATGSHYTTELVLTNRGAGAVSLEYLYTASFGSGSGTAADSLAPGEQRVVPDAVAYLRERGIPIATGANQGGTLAVRIGNAASPDEVAVTARTTSPVVEGRAGLSYPAVSSTALLTGRVVIGGLRQSDADRSHLALLNAGGAADGDVRLRVTLFSADGPAGGLALADETLAPGRFVQLNEVLRSAGLAGGYATVERVSGSAPFYAYGAVVDQHNNDGSYVPPLVPANHAGRAGLTLPVVVESAAFSTELVLANFGTSARVVDLRYVAGAIPGGSATLRLTLQPREQRLIPDFVQFLRDQSSGVPARGPTLAGALFLTVPGGDVTGIFLGGRTSSPAPAGAGRYGLFYTATPYGQAAVSEAFVYALQQDGEDRTNLAFVNTGEVDDSADTLRVELFDGRTGSRAGDFDVTLAARSFRQVSAVLANHAAGVTSGYARITRTSGGNPFLVYAVTNDGAAPGERSGDGAYISPDIGCSFELGPATRTFPAGGGSDTIAIRTRADCVWTVASHDAFVTLTGATSGQGDGTVTYSVAPSAGAARSGTLSVAGRTLSLQQTAASSPPLTLSATPASLSVDAGGFASTSISAGNGTADEVTFAAKGLPAGVAIDFSPNPSAGGSIAIFLASASVAAGTYPVTISGSARNAGGSSVQVLLTVSPPDIAASALVLELPEPAVLSGQPISVTWRLPRNLPVGAAMTVLVRAPRDTPFPPGDFGVPPPDGPIYYLTSSRAWSDTRVTFAAPPTPATLAFHLPSIVAGGWYLQVEITDAAGGLVARARRPFLVSSKASIYLPGSRPVASSGDAVRTTLITSAGDTTRRVKLAAWLATPDGRRLGLPGLRDDTAFVYDGPSRSELLTLLDRELGSVAGTGRYSVQVRLFDAVSGKPLAAASAAIDVCDTPAAVGGAVLDAAGRPLQGRVEVSAFDLDDGLVTASSSMDGNGRFGLTLVPGRYLLSAVAVSASGVRRVAAAPLRVSCGDQAATVTLKEGL